MGSNSSMSGAKALLEMLRGYEVRHVFGLPGETTLELYMEWHNYPEIKHVMARDERSACYMADAYARASYKPGICESPSPGAAHIVPAVVEAYRSSAPMIAITTDVPLHLERRNMLTSYDQSSIFRAITKESITITRASEIPHIVRRAFRIATTGKPGPVHLRIPMDVLEEEAVFSDIYAQKEFSRYPGHRFAASIDSIRKALDLILSSENPVIVCGQGALYSQAWDEVRELAELLGIPVATTTMGKGCFPEDHPLSIGVIGARGGTSFSNKILSESDLIFYIGADLDSIATNTWSLPKPLEGREIIHLDISEANASNNYPEALSLIGDAKATLGVMIDMLDKRIARGYGESPRIKDLIARRREYEESLKNYMDYGELVNPLRLVKELERKIPGDHLIVADPGVGAIYMLAFYKVKKAGRSVITNYSIGSLGYAIPASVGAYFARPDSYVVVLTGDGSFGLNAGELETIARVNGNIKIFLFNNNSYGWIRAEIFYKHGARFFATDFKPVDYVKIAEGFGIEAMRIESNNKIEKTIDKVFRNRDPVLAEVLVEPQDKLCPPVPAWVERARNRGVGYIY
ncbi:MAG: thiamine pyrophosphate-binding protein [Sulfolobales archaeon]